MSSTTQKMFLARKLLSFLLLLGIKPRQLVSRQGVMFELDLLEGIDLSLFLFGSFQKHILTIVEKYVPEDGVIIDVGANIGAIALTIANVLSKSHVFAIEPTDFAFSKLLKNISLNPHLTNRVFPVQTFLADENAAQSDLAAYSSWRLKDFAAVGDRHPIHEGIRMSAECGQITLDEFVTKQALQSVSLIKVDTDGHEFKVLTGARNCIERFRPLVIFEACEYLMLPPNQTFEDYERFFSRHSYYICETGSTKQITLASFKEKCPK